MVKSCRSLPGQEMRGRLNQLAAEGLRPCRAATEGLRRSKEANEGLRLQPAAKKSGMLALLV